MKLKELLKEYCGIYEYLNCYYKDGKWNITISGNADFKRYPYEEVDVIKYDLYETECLCGIGAGSKRSTIKQLHIELDADECRIIAKQKVKDAKEKRKKDS